MKMPKNSKRYAVGIVIREEPVAKTLEHVEVSFEKHASAQEVFTKIVNALLEQKGRFVDDDD
jgi:hypothetical protein